MYLHVAMVSETVLLNGDTVPQLTSGTGIICVI